MAATKIKYKKIWIPACAGMTLGYWIPACTGMTLRYWIPACAGMTSGYMKVYVLQTLCENSLGVQDRADNGGPELLEDGGGPAGLAGTGRISTERTNNAVGQGGDYTAFRTIE